MAANICPRCGSETERLYLCAECKTALKAAVNAAAAPIIAQRNADRMARRAASVRAMNYAKRSGA